jgi:alkaline phosphatase D
VKLLRVVNWVDVMLQYTLNEFIKGKEVDIFLLDERYNRDTLPCHVRKSFCRDVVLPNLDHQEYAWYVDGFP